MRKAGLDKAQTGIKIARRNINNLTYADDMILYMENPKDSTRKLLELINEYSKVAGYKINTQKSQAGFRKGRGTRDQIANIHWIIKKQESFRKTSISALLAMP